MGKIRRKRLFAGKKRGNGGLSIVDPYLLKPGYGLLGKYLIEEKVTRKTANFLFSNCE